MTQTAERNFTAAAPDLPPDLPDLPPDRLAAPDLQPPDPQGRRPLHNVLHRQPGIGTSATIFVGRHPPSRHSRPPNHHKPGITGPNIKLQRPRPTPPSLTSISPSSSALTLPIIFLTSSPSVLLPISPLLYPPSLFTPITTTSTPATITPPTLTTTTSYIPPPPTQFYRND